MRLTLTALALSMLAGCAADVPYKNCSSIDNCGGGDTPLCLQSAAPSGSTARFCTARCNTPTGAASAECPANSACVAVNGGGPYCLQRCTADSECPFTNGACLVTGDSMGQRVCTVRP